MRLPIEIDGRRHELGLPATLLAGLAGAVPAVVAAPSAAVMEGAVTAPVAGTLVRWLVAPDAPVAEGEAVAVLEAMKMETRVTAPGRAGSSCWSRRDRPFPMAP
ncbi:acetyl-CoA carboxylase biotin carboxyl carrier protein subunit [Gemmobacter lanyuensis]